MGRVDGPSLRRAAHRRLLHDERGTVVVEYVIVLALAAVGIVAAMTLAGALLLRLYIYQRHVLLLPFP